MRPLHRLDEAARLSAIEAAAAARFREQGLAWIAEGGLRVIERHDVRPEHAKATEGGDALAAARAAIKEKQAKPAKKAAKKK